MSVLADLAWEDRSEVGTHAKVAMIFVIPLIAV